MRENNFPVVRYIVLFASCYGIYKGINIIDSCVRTYLVHKYKMRTEYRALDLSEFFDDGDWD